MTTTFKIVRWDSVLDSCGINPKPMIYVKPTKEFIEYVKRNKYMVFVKIDETGKPGYDCKMWGIVKKSAFAGGCRPNFFDKTNLWTITLDKFWNGYPKHLGTVSFNPGPVPPKKENIEAEQIDIKKYETKKYRIIIMTIFSIILICLLILLILAWVFGRKR